MAYLLLMQEPVSSWNDYADKLGIDTDCHQTVLSQLLVGFVLYNSPQYDTPSNSAIN